ncbi:hypothetical protein RZS08_15550, partial [Arthrospira platensis SPKY1]|nr:hypothetical protein [Arthrospira platensis SPKY1]
AILAGLKRQGIEICELSDETDLKNWLKKRNQPARSLLMAFAYNDHKKVRRICESVNLEAPGLQTILSLQGLNPEHFSDLIGKKFDSLIMPNAKTSATLKNILTHLSSHAKPKGASMQDNE